MNVTVVIPDDKVSSMLEAIGQSDAENQTTAIKSWLTSHARDILWQHERNAASAGAAASVGNPIP